MRCKTVTNSLPDRCGAKLSPMRGKKKPFRCLDFTLFVINMHQNRSISPFWHHLAPFRVCPTLGLCHICVVIYEYSHYLYHKHQLDFKKCWQWQKWNVFRTEIAVNNFIIGTEFFKWESFLCPFNSFLIYFIVSDFGLSMQALMVRCVSIFKSFFISYERRALAFRYDAPRQ